MIATRKTVDRRVRCPVPPLLPLSHLKGLDELEGEPVYRIAKGLDGKPTQGPLLAHVLRANTVEEYSSPPKRFIDVTIRGAFGRDPLEGTDAIGFFFEPLEYLREEEAAALGLKDWAPKKYGRVPGPWRITWFGATTPEEAK